MRNHFLFKFTALVLCTVLLCLTLITGVGVFALNETGLYQQDVEQVYYDYLETRAAVYSADTVPRYASMNLGGLTLEMANAYYSDYWVYQPFRWGRVGYRILDENGQVLQGQELEEGMPVAYRFSFPASGNYIRIHSTVPQQEYNAATVTTEVSYAVVEQEHRIYDAVPLEGITVDSMTISYHGSSQGVAVPGGLGRLDHDVNGYVVFSSWEPGILDIGTGETITGILFENEEVGLVFEADCPSGVGQLYYDENNYVNFRSSVVSPDYVIAETIPAEAAPQITEVGGAAGFAEVDQNSVLYQYPRLDSEQLGTVGEAEGTLAVFGPYDIDGSYWYQTEQGWIPAEPLATGASADRKVTTDGTEPTQIETIPTEETPPEQVTIPTEAVPEDTVPAEETPALFNFTYYDSETGMSMVAYYTEHAMPDYTVEVVLAENPLNSEYEWVMLRLLYSYRDQLLPVLGGSLVLLMLCIVYLCCTAARRPGTDERRAGGLNRLPLDLYALIAGAGATGAVVFSVEGMEYLLDGSVEVAVSFALAMLYAACVLVVGFFYALVAQLKTPGGFWWRNSAWVRLLELCVKICKWLLGATLRFCAALSRWTDARGWPRLKRLIKWAWGIVAAIWLWFWNGLKWIYRKLHRGFDRVYSLLPLTWQWLLAGFGLAMLLMLSLASRNGFTVLLCLALGVLIILYGAQSFGLLLEAVRRMARGDLEEQVEEKRLVGSFRDFAKALNSLAGVAVVAAQKQLKSERMKTELITNVSHDIKTPLTSIINYVDLLQKPHTPDEQEVYLEVLSRQSQRLKKLIEDLMEMSKASTGNMSVDIRKVDATEAVNQALGEFADKLDRAQLIPVFHQPEQGVYMMADGRLVWRVLSNLLSNAVKYALPGTRLYLDLNRVEDKVVISLKNISREELNVNADELLERFVRGDASRNTEGSGLGLNIAQSLMELQKGQLQLLVDGDLFKVTLIFPGA